MKLSTRGLIICAIFASITAILAQISIPLPFSTVPLTMQVFAVTISGIILGAKKGLISQLIYVTLGAIGMPVFAGMSGGMGMVFGYTGGFIISFPIMALVINYSIGTLWYSFVAGVGIVQGFTVCVAPFLIADIIKICLATTIGISVKSRIKKEVYSC